MDESNTQTDTVNTNPLTNDAEFFKNVRAWMSSTEKMKELQEEMKELRDIKNKAEAVIIEKMTAAKEDTIAFQKGGNLRRTVSETTKAVKKEDIALAISKLTNDMGQAEKITESIYKARVSSQRVYLKHNKGRKPKEPKESNDAV